MEQHSVRRWHNPSLLEVQMGLLGRTHSAKGDAALASEKMRLQQTVQAFPDFS